MQSLMNGFFYMGWIDGFFKAWVWSVCAKSEKWPFHGHPNGTQKVYQATISKSIMHNVKKLYFYT